MMLPVFYFFDIYSLIVLQICGLSHSFASFTAIVYLFSALLFRDVTAIPHPVHLSPFYFLNKLPGVMNLSQTQLPALQLQCTDTKTCILLFLSSARVSFSFPLYLLFVSPILS
jgi:hypothetical protein